MLSFSASCATIWRIGCDLRTGLVALYSQSVELTLWKNKGRLIQETQADEAFSDLVSDPKKVERYNKMRSLMKITGRRVDLAMKPVESARDRIFSADLLCLLAETCLRQSGWLPSQILGTGMHAVCGPQLLQVTTGSHLVPLDLGVRCSQQEQDHNFTQAVQNYQTSGRPSLLFHIVPAQVN